MTRFSKRAKKWFVALAGVGVLIALQQYNVHLPGFPQVVSDMLVGLLAAEGVYQVRNDA